MTATYLRSWLDDRQADGRSFTGYQVSFVSGSRSVDLCGGLDALARPVSADSLIPGRCTVTKPLIALALCRLHVRGRVDLYSDTVADFGLDGAPHVAALTLAQLLGHSGGLHLMPAAAYSLVRPEARLTLALHLPAPEGWNPSLNRAYDEGGAWLILGRVLELVCGRSYDEEVADLLADLGLAPNGIVLRPTADETDDSWLRRVAIDGAPRSNTTLRPQLVAGIRAHASEWGPSWSGFATMPALARFSARLAAAANDGDELGEAVRLVASRFRVDESTGHAHGLGVNADMASWLGLPSLGSRSFGHVARAAMTIAVPERAAGIAISLLSTPEDVAFREELWRRVIELGLAAVEDG